VRPVPSLRRLLLATLAAFLLWGLVFGLIDNRLWTASNWIESAVYALVSMTAMQLFTRGRFSGRMGSGQSG
jgi:hypothetical protein